MKNILKALYIASPMLIMIFLIGNRLITSISIPYCTTYQNTGAGFGGDYILDHNVPCGFWQRFLGINRGDIYFERGVILFWLLNLVLFIIWLVVLKNLSKKTIKPIERK